MVKSVFAKMRLNVQDKDEKMSKCSWLLRSGRCVRAKCSSSRKAAGTEYLAAGCRT